MGHPPQFLLLVLVNGGSAVAPNLVERGGDVLAVAVEPGEQGRCISEEPLSCGIGSVYYLHGMGLTQYNMQVGPGEDRGMGEAPLGSAVQQYWEVRSSGYLPGWGVLSCLWNACFLNGETASCDW